MSDHLELIAQILAKAERTNHPEEADMLFARAQRLASRHSIDLAMARQHTAKQEQREEIEERTVRLGYRGQKGLARLVRLFLNIAEVNDVKCLISSDSTTMYAHGFPSDIEVVEALYASLSVQMVHAADRYIKSGEHKKETVFVPGHHKKVRCSEDDVYGEYDYRRGYDVKWVYVEGKEKPLDGRTARQNFYAAFATRIKARLQEAQREAQQDAETAQQAAETAQQAAEAPTAQPVENAAQEPVQAAANLPVSVALVLAEKREQVAQWHDEYKRKNKIRGSWGGERRSKTTYSHSARQAGDRAGRNATLTSHKSIGA